MLSEETATVSATCHSTLAQQSRSQPISRKTFPHIKKLILDMTDAEGKSFTEIIEDAVTRRDAELRGKR
jgi:hypothetical protein